MRPRLLSRIVAALAALALLLTLGAQGMHAAAMATMSSEMSVATMKADAAPGGCTICDGSDKVTAAQCQPMCAPAPAVLPLVGTVSQGFLPESFEGQNLTCAGRTGTPEPHPPKPAALV
jgi:hypothetical protein